MPNHPKLSERARDALATAEVIHRTDPDSSNGRMLVRLGCGQLDRLVYQEVATALSRIGNGGAWSRRYQGFVYSAGDPSEGLREACQTGLMPPDTAKQAGFIRTPEPLARDLVAMGLAMGAGADGHDRPVADETALEPSAGDGQIANAMRRAGIQPVCVEQDADRAGLLRASSYMTHETDFLTWAAACPTRYSLVVMNPPFATATSRTAWIDHLLAAAGLLTATGRLVSVAPAGLTFRNDRRHATVRELVHQSGGGWRDLPDDTFTASGATVRTCVVWMGRPPSIIHHPPAGRR